MTSAELEIRGLRFRYPGGDDPVLNGVDLFVAAGERVALLGPNGSGKTTLALHLNGLLETQSGAVSVGGLRVEPQHYPVIRRRVGFVFQDANDQLFMPSVREDVGFGPANLGFSGDEKHQIVERSLDAVDALELADRSPHQLSGGEKRRVAIATVLAMDPDVVVLDEPTAGLDPLGQRELAELIVTMPQTLLVVTHDLPFVLATCPRSVVLDRGEIVADAPTGELLADTALLARHRLELPFGYGSAIAEGAVPSLAAHERHHPDSAV